MKTFRREWLPLTAILLMAAVSLSAWSRVPERLPVHWGLGAQPDRFGGRFEALGVFPLVGLSLYVLALVLPRAVTQPEQNRKLTGAVLRIVVLGLAALHLGLVANYLGAELAVPRLTGLVVGVILMGVGNLLPKAQPSRWVGVRTPWTFKSKESWYKSQRAGGWVMTLSGLAFVVTALLTSSGTVLFVVVAATLLAFSGLLLYSYLVWRGDRVHEPSL